MGVDGIAERFNHFWEEGIGVYLALFACAHVGGSHEEYSSLWAAAAETVNLMSHIGAVGIDRLLAFEVGDGVATKLKDDEADVHLAVGIGQLLSVDLGELVARAATHGDVVDRHSGTVIDKDAIDVGLAADVESHGGGGAVELPLKSMYAGLLLSLIVGIAASAVGECDVEGTRPVTEYDFELRELS